MKPFHRLASATLIAITFAALAPHAQAGHQWISFSEETAEAEGVTLFKNVIVWTGENSAHRIAAQASEEGSPDLNRVCRALGKSEHVYTSLVTVPVAALIEASSEKTSPLSFIFGRTVNSDIPAVNHIACR
ncbi:MAG: hypothetical protein HUU37_08110 [Bdellovibrionales bacterium]|nr:hypothetical protein [Bdellovibrionales bacterium]